jgi:hypothetical protein
MKFLILTCLFFSCCSHSYAIQESDFMIPAPEISPYSVPQTVSEAPDTEKESLYKEIKDIFSQNDKSFKAIAGLGIALSSIGYSAYQIYLLEPDQRNLLFHFLLSTIEWRP